MINSNKNNQYMSKRIQKIILIATIILLVSFEIKPQVESSLQFFNRGSLWQSVQFGKVGPTYNNWRKTGPSLDWPAFDESWIRDDIGGSPSHMVAGGFWIGAKKSNDSVLVVEDWSMYAGTVSDEPGSKYIVRKHGHLYKNGENHWLRTNPNVGEEVIETIWEYNVNYFRENDLERQLPLRVTRRVHQWNGSMKDENYIIYEYVFKNISNEILATNPNRVIVDSLYKLYTLLNYGLQSNSRSWNVLFRQETPGARNTWFFYDPVKKMIWGRSADYKTTQGIDESYGFSNSLGRIINGQPSGEYLAPGFVGVSLFYSSPDSTGLATRIGTGRVGWSAAENSLDLSGPFTGVSGTNEGKYSVLQNPSNAYRFVTSFADTNYMLKNRMWSLMALGPWNLFPGDSIRIVLAEIVNGMDAKFLFDKNLTQNALFTASNKAFTDSYNRAKFTFDNNMNHPDPPAAPKFTLDFYKGATQLAANVILWGNETESYPDPDDGELDLAGYNIYRSDFLPYGPWEKIATITKGDANYFDLLTNKYSYVDSSVEIGRSYYYSLTAFDTGKASWPINPTARFPETNSNAVPPMESSIFANRMSEPFLATLPAKNEVNDVLVVPNPFVIGEGFSRPGEGSDIQFVNVPNPSTIRIYTIRGDLVKTINVGDNVGGIVTWDQVTDFGQFVVSGVYIYHIESPYGKKIGKFAIVR